MPQAKSSSSIRFAPVEDDVNFQDALIEAIKTTTDMVLINVAGTRKLGLEMLDKVMADVLLVDLY